MSDATGPAHMDFRRLLDVVAELRGDQGCPWDREQTPASLRPYIVEEAHEVVEAIDSGDPALLCDELVLQAQLAEEQDLFDAGDVCRAIRDKMVRRHPHVFGDAEARDAASVLSAWERLKADERGADDQERRSVLSGVPRAMPALLRASRLSEKAAAVGFDWPTVDGVLDKIEEEIGELREALTEGGPVVGGPAVEHELGDLLFAMANLGRTLSVGPEDALRAANDRFVRRFHVIEERLAELGIALDDASLEQMEALWQEAKRREGQD